MIDCNSELEVNSGVNRLLCRIGNANSFTDVIEILYVDRNLLENISVNTWR